MKSLVRRGSALSLKQKFDMMSKKFLLRRAQNRKSFHNVGRKLEIIMIQIITYLCKLSRTYEYR
jgi:hypothetical protein